MRRHELEPIVANERRGGSEKTSISPSAATVIGEESTLQAEEEIGAVAHPEAQMEARQRAETGLLQCREMCTNMACTKSPQKGARRSIFGSGRGGSESGGGGGGDGGGTGV